MSEKELAEMAMDYGDKNILAVLGVMLMGFVARALLAKEKVNWPSFFGEMIITGIGALALFAGGMLRGMSPLEIFFFGCCASLGSVRLLSWLIKIAATMRGMS